MPLPKPAVVIASRGAFVESLGVFVAETTIPVTDTTNSFCFSSFLSSRGAESRGLTNTFTEVGGTRVSPPPCSETPVGFPFPPARRGVGTGVLVANRPTFDGGGISPGALEERSPFSGHAASITVVADVSVPFGESPQLPPPLTWLGV